MSVDSATKRAFNKKIADQKSCIQDANKEIAMYRKGIAQKNNLAPFFHLGIVAKYLTQIHLNLDMNALSESMMDIKNSSYLDNARKLEYKIISEMQNVCTLEIDEPLDFNRKQLDAIKLLTPKKRLNFYKHLKHSIQKLMDGYGENTKWKWSFPELWGKIAIIAKNMIDFREIESIRDPREEFYYDRQEMLTLVKDDLFNASNQYRNKFELSTKSNNDLLMAIRLLESLRRIASLTNDQELVKKCKSGIESYHSRIEAEASGKKKKKKKK